MAFLLNALRKVRVTFHLYISKQNLSLLFCSAVFTPCLSIFTSVLQRHNIVFERPNVSKHSQNRQAWAYAFFLTPVHELYIALWGFTFLCQANALTKSYIRRIHECLFSKNPRKRLFLQVRWWSECVILGNLCSFGSQRLMGVSAHIRQQWRWRSPSETLT